MPQSYIKPIVSDLTITPKIAKKIASEEGTDWSENFSIVWISSIHSSQYEKKEMNNVSSFEGYSLKEIEKIRLDFKANFNNFHKYPKITEKDWK